MIRRGSVSSVGSGSIVNGGRGAPQMARRGSQSSMTERTFRSPSPGAVRPQSRGGHVPAATDAPPVPAVSTPSQQTQRRSASVEPPIQRVTSPTPPRGSRGVSLDRTNQTGIGKRISSLPKLPELERENSDRSINFSRPIASPSVSPPASSTRPQTAGSWFGAPTQSNGTPRTTLPTHKVSTTALSNGEVSGIQNDLQNAANKPAKKKKKPPTTSEGSYLTTGTMTAAPQGTAVVNLAADRASPAPSSRPQSPMSTPASRTPAANMVPSTATTTTTTPSKKKKKQVTTPTVDAEVNPPPRNPARTSLSPSPNSRASHMLQKQPLVVREDPEGEASAAPSQDSSYPRFGSTDMSTPSRSGSIIQTSEGPAVPYTSQTRPGRAASLEVPDAHYKSAHFNSALVDANGVRHTPPPRSVSPAKSALKHSPSSSLRASSPQLYHASTRGPASDTSDTLSLASQDGVKPSKKKKGVRVSFDADVVETIPEPQPQQTRDIRRSLSPTTTVDDEMEDLMKPRPALPSFGSVRKSSSSSQPQMAEKVTETLPLSSASPRSAVPSGNLQASSDHAAGALLANHHAQQSVTGKDVEAPLPPQFTNAEEIGEQSEESHYSDDEAPVEATAPVVSREQPLQESSVIAHQSTGGFTAADLGIPDISVLPATPGIEEEVNAPLELPASQNRYSVPGGWGEPEEADRDHRTEPAALDIVTDDEMEGGSPLLDPIRESDSDDSDAFSDAAEDPSEFEGGFASLDAIVHSPFASPEAKPVAAPLESPITRTRTISSDEEEPQEARGDWSEATAYWSSLSKTHKRQLEQQASVGQSKPAPALTEEPKKKKQPKFADDVQAAPAPAPAPAVQPVAQQAPKPPLKPALKQKAVQSSTQAEPTMRKSMRAPQQQAAPLASTEPVSMRKSMRSEGAARGTGNMRSSMRDGQSAKPRPQSMLSMGQPQPAIQAKSMRPSSAGALGPSGPPASASAAASRKAQSNKNAGLPTSYSLPQMQGDDSDSESSFKKKRRPSASTVDSMGKYNMRRSMRGNSVDVGSERRPMSPVGASASSRWSIRSSSPPASANHGNFRQSLRKGSVDDTPTMRGKNSKARARDSKSPSRFSVSSFMSASKPVAAPAPSAKSRSSGFKSRFNDSDDEDDAPASRPTGGFRSRFADSDDEAESPTVPHQFAAADMTPVRGIPRRQNQDDSTDLDDSEEEVPTRSSKAITGSSKKTPVVPNPTDIDKVMELARRNVAAQTGNESIALPDGPSTPRKRVTLRTEPEPAPQNSPQKSVESTADGLNKRRGLLGSIFGRKRTESSSTLPRYTGQPAPSAASASVPTSPINPRSGKLQRRNTGQLSRTNSGVPPMLLTQQQASTPAATAQTNQNWPLPPPIPASAPMADNRPNTSDGQVTTKQSSANPMRPEVGKRSQSGLVAGQNGVRVEQPGKKKRFGMFRKAFGLND